jgi:DNA-binding MurR/RpiR family transcriptional regulator
MKPRGGMENSIESNNNHYTRIKSFFSSMSAAQRKIADYVIANSEKIPNFTVTQLAQKTGVDPASITRFCQFLGFKGYSDFRYSISHHLVSPQAIEFEPYCENDSVSGIMEKMKSNCQQIWQDVYQLIDPGLIERAARMIYNAKAVYIFAAGGSTGTAYYTQKMLLHIGIQCYRYSDIMFSLPASEHLTGEDTVIALSCSGEGKMVVESTKNAKKRHANVIGITGNSTSDLAKNSNIVLCFNSRIPDDLMYVHMVCIMEISIIAMLQHTIYNKYHKELLPFLPKTKDAIKIALNN